MNLPEKKIILFTLVYKNEQFAVQAARNEYRSLRSLISDRLSISGFGLCSGMGSCGTCMVNICSGNSRQGVSTLSCNVAVNDILANTEITIPERLY